MTCLVFAKAWRKHLIYCEILLRPQNSPIREAPETLGARFCRTYWPLLVPSFPCLLIPFYSEERPGCATDFCPLILICSVHTKELTFLRAVQPNFIEPTQVVLVRELADNGKWTLRRSSTATLPCGKHNSRVMHWSHPGNAFTARFLRPPRTCVANLTSVNGLSDFHINLSRLRLFRLG